MNNMFYTGKSGLSAYENAVNVTAHNIANTSTTGYKSTKANFRELVYNNMDINKNDALTEETSVKSGHGVRIYDDSLQFTQGELAKSDYPLDFALEGDGLFAVERDGAVQYTRDGTFDISVEAGGNYLVTSDGAYVLDANSQKIIVPDAADGTLDTGAVKNAIGVFDFTNPYGLQRAGDQSFYQTEISGEAQPMEAGTYKLLESYTERSNVDIAKEMSDMIVLQRAYQFSSRVVQTADEMEDTVNALRR
ncbi:MAG: flagellar hook-basal body protein [Oscillospiraceae bacterium]